MPFTKIQKVEIHRVCNSYAIIGCLPESRMGYKKWCIVMILNYRVSQKNALSECCWSHSALAQSPFAGTPCVWRLIFWSFLTKTKQDQAPPSHVNGKIYSHRHSTQFWLWFCSFSTFFGTPCTSWSYNQHALWHGLQLTIANWKLKYLGVSFWMRNTF